MSASTTKVAIASNALVMVGDSTISDFDGSTTGAILMDEVFDDVVEDLLTSHPWRFAIKQSDLSLLSGEPEALWDAAYQLPSDFLTLHRITVNDTDIDFEVYGDQVFCNAASTSTVTANYTHYPDVVAWPAYFRMGVTLTLASLAASTYGKADVAEVFETKADFQLRRARNRDSQIDTVPTINTSRFITNRRS